MKWSYKMILRIAFDLIWHFIWKCSVKWQSAKVNQRFPGCKQQLVQNDSFVDFSAAHML